MSSPPVKIVTAPYTGPHPCDKCGKKVSNGKRVVGTNIGDAVTKTLILCKTCYRDFEKALAPFTGKTG